MTFPIEILGQILHFLDLKSYRTCSLISDPWSQAFELLEKLYKRHSSRESKDEFITWKEIYQEEFYFVKSQSLFSSHAVECQMVNTLKSQDQMKGLTVQDYYEWQSFDHDGISSHKSIQFLQNRIYVVDKNEGQIDCLTTGKRESEIIQGRPISSTNSPFLLIHDMGDSTLNVYTLEKDTETLQFLYKLEISPPQIPEYSVLYGNLFITSLRHDTRPTDIHKIAIYELGKLDYHTHQCLELFGFHQFCMDISSNFFVIGPLFPHADTRRGIAQGKIHVYNHLGCLQREFHGPVVKGPPGQIHSRLQTLESELAISKAGHILLLTKDATGVCTNLYTPEGHILFSVHSEKFQCPPVPRFSLSGESLVAVGHHTWIMDFLNQKIYIFKVTESDFYRKRGVFLYGFDSDSGLPRISFIQN